MCLWRITSKPINCLIAWVVLLVAVSTKSVAAQRSLMMSGESTLSSRDCKSLALNTWRIAMACSAEALQRTRSRSCSLLVPRDSPTSAPTSEPPWLGPSQAYLESLRAPLCGQWTVTWHPLLFSASSRQSPLGPRLRMRPLKGRSRCCTLGSGSLVLSMHTDRSAHCGQYNVSIAPLA